MRAVGLGADVVVVTSRIWQTTCTLLRAGDEAFVVDSPMLPDELEILPSVADQAGFRVVGRLATHGDFDHVLAGYAFPDAPLGVGETTAARLLTGDAQRELREWDEEWYVDRPGPLALPSPQVLPVPGHVGIGDHELELHPTAGHTADGMAVWAPWLGVLCPGDYLSPVEIPWINDSAEAYLATLERLEPLVEQAAWVVPGHGEPLDGARALAILREDRDYVRALPGAKLPLARRTAAQKRIHERNLRHVRPTDPAGAG